MSLPAMESLRADYTEVWCATQNVALARFANCARSIASVGLDRLGFLPADDAIERLRDFDSIVSWYGSGNDDFRALTHGLGIDIRFLDSVPDGRMHAVDFYNSQVAGTPTRFPWIECPAVPRTFAAIHPFASSLGKRAPLDAFRRAAEQLGESMPVEWFCGPDEELRGATCIGDLYELACRLRGARIFVGNDSGISHLAAAVGTPVVTFFETTDLKVWSPRGSSAWF